MNRSFVLSHVRSHSTASVRNFTRMSRNALVRTAGFFAALGAFGASAFGQASVPTPNSSTEGVVPAQNSKLLDFGPQVAVDLHEGEVFYRSVDMSIPGKGLDFAFVRVYRSQITYGGPLGWNWSHNFDQRVLLSGSDVQHVDGLRLTVDTYSSVATNLYECDTPGVYRKARLDGTEWCIREREGTIRRFWPLDGSAKQGRLKSIRDRFGNQLTVDYDAQGRVSTITDTLSRNVTLAYNGAGRVSTLTDFSGRVVTYAYNGSDLASVTYPPITGTPVGPDGLNGDFPAGKTQAYQYTTASQTDPMLQHNLWKLTNPREQATSGAPVMTLSYTGDRLTSALVGTGTYGLAFGSGQTGEASQTTLTDRRGYVTQYGFDTDGHALRVQEFTAGLRPSDPASFTTKFTYTADGEIKKQIYADGRVETYVQDTNADRFRQGNRLSAILSPVDAAPGPESPFLKNIIREPIYNQAIDSAQSGGSITLDYQEASSSSNGLAQLIADWGISTGGFNLTPQGDVNGDGTTTQIGGNIIVRRSAQLTIGVPAPVQAVWTNTFDASGRLLTLASPEGVLSVHQYASDANGGLLASFIEDADPSAPGIPPNAGTARWSRPAWVEHVAATTSFVRDAVGNVTSTTDSRGVKTQHVVNSHNEVVKIVRAHAVDAAVLDPVLAQMQALGFGNLVKPALITHFRYDANGNVVRIDEENRQSGSGNTWHTRLQGFNLENRRTTDSVEVSNGVYATTTTSYDANGNVMLVTHPEGNEDSRAYDERNLLLTETAGSSDPAIQGVTKYNYTATRQIASIEQPTDLDGDGQLEKTLNEYDGDGRLYQTINPVGTQDRNGYNNDNKLSGRSTYGTVGGASPQSNETSGNTLLCFASESVDELNRLIRLQRSRFVPSGQPGTLPYTAPNDFVVTERRYDLDGNVVREIEPNGHTLDHVYNGLGLVVQSTDELGNVVEIDYDAGGFAIRSTATDANSLNPAQPEVRVTGWAYDGLGRLITEYRPGGLTSYYWYDGRNLRTCEADANGPAMTDAVGIVGGTVNSPGNIKRWIHDGLGNVTESYADKYPNGVGVGSWAMFMTSFNPANTPSGTVGTEHTSFNYDLNGNMIAFETATGNVTFTYDDRDRLKRKTYPDGSYQELTYFRTASLVQLDSLYNSSGSFFRRTQFAYDGAGRKVQETTILPGGTQIEGSMLRTYQFNGMDLCTQATDDNGAHPDSTVTRMYDSLGRTLQETQNGAVVSMELDDAGKATKQWFPNGRWIGRAYDARRRVADITESSGSSIAAFDYFGTRRLAQIELVAGLKQSLAASSGGGAPTGYDAADNPARVQHVTGGGTVLTNIAAAFDRRRSRLSEQRAIAGGTTRSDLAEYDSLNYLTSFERDKPATGPAELSQDYVFASDGNLDTVTVSADGAAPSSHDFALGSVWNYSSIDAQAQLFDLAGNKSRDFWFNYYFDASDRLVRVAQRYTGQTFLRFAYDAFGRRTEKKAFEGTSQEKTDRFYYFDEHIAEVRNASGTTTAQFVHGDRTDEVVQMRADVDANGSLEAYTLLSNAQGSVVALVDATGAIVERYSYDAYGAPAFLEPDGTQSTSGGLPILASAYSNPFLFTGREYDWEPALFKVALGFAGYFSEWGQAHGLYFYRARYMDPVEGRFTSRDPLSPAGNRPVAPSLLVGRILSQAHFQSPYHYVSNDPLNRVDPSGREDEPCDPGESPPPGFDGDPPDLGDAASAVLGDLCPEHIGEVIVASIVDAGGWAWGGIKSFFTCPPESMRTQGGIFADSSCLLTNLDGKPYTACWGLPPGFSTRPGERINNPEGYVTPPYVCSAATAGAIAYPCYVPPPAPPAPPPFPPDLCHLGIASSGGPTTPEYVPPTPGAGAPGAPGGSGGSGGSGPTGSSANGLCPITPEASTYRGWYKGDDGLCRQFDEHKCPDNYQGGGGFGGGQIGGMASLQRPQPTVAALDVASEGDHVRIRWLPNVSGTFEVERLGATDVLVASGSVDASKLVTLRDDSGGNGATYRLRVRDEYGAQSEFGPFVARSDISDNGRRALERVTNRAQPAQARASDSRTSWTTFGLLASLATFAALAASFAGRQR